MRRLIINADDFGLTPGVNRAILEAHEHGLVTSATLMANAPGFAEAVSLAQTVPRLSVGCHVVLVDGSPVLSASQVPTLLQRRAGRHFRNGLGGFAALGVMGRLDAGQIEAEAAAQIRKLQSGGITVSHIDTHKHTHMFSAVLRPLLRAARACGLRSVRNPFAQERLPGLAARPDLWKRRIRVKALQGLAGNFRRVAQEACMTTPDGTLGIVATGTLDERLFRFMIEHLPEGTWEFVCHPGYDDAQLQSTGTRLRKSREQELQMLTSSASRDLLAHHGIQLISYRDL